MGFYLAVDVGGTKTDYVLADDARELARVRTGTIKRLRVDAQTASANLERALAELSERSGISTDRITRTCVGTAGESVPLVRDWLRDAVTARVAGELILVGDVEIALDAAFRGGPGVLVMAGTGSNVAGRAGDGRVTTAGGWGPALGDQGSGHRIGLEALRAAFLGRDEGRHSSLLEAAQRFWKLQSLEALVEAANATPAPDFSALTEVVLRCTTEGDTAASSVLQQEGRSLGWLVRLVLRRLRSDDKIPGALPQIAFTGSILEKVLPVRSAMLEAVREEFPSACLIEAAVDPIAGALWRARKGA